MASLPDDILYMICVQLYHQRDFNTLFSCACAGKRLSLPALMNLYRMHDVAPVINGGSDELRVSNQDQWDSTRFGCWVQGTVICIKWAGLWRSLILSSLNKTLYPYSHYIRTLNLRDLEELLSDPKFKEGVSQEFFRGEMAVFRVENSTGSKRRQLDAVETINRIGEAITKQAPLIEELIGNVLNPFLSRWLPRLPRLKHLNPWQGGCLAGTGDLLHRHCPSFKTLKFWAWVHCDADYLMSAFLNELRPRSLESFEIFSYSEIGIESLTALNSHAQSLTDLKLNRIPPKAMPGISFLKDCTNLVSLSLAEAIQPYTDLKTSHKGVFSEIIEWLKNCKKLRYISFKNFLHASDIMTPVLLENGIHLTSLEYEGYQMKDVRAFHQAIANQTSLETLLLRGETDDLGTDGIDVLVESVCKLVNLTDLCLKDIADYFRDNEISRVARSLPKLETWSTGGYGITDYIWHDVSSLKSLRRLELSALTDFSAEGILDFIQRLGPGNKGLVIAVMNAEMESDLTVGEQSLIKDKLAAKVDGKFEFTLSRDPDLSFSSEDSED